MSHPKLVTSVAALSWLCACAGGAYSPSLKSSTAADSTAMADFSNRIILENIVRAKLRKPLNYSDLASINDSTSLSATVTPTLEFGQTHGSTTRDSAAPGLTFSRSPTASISSLNEQGFILTMMQPVSPQYVLSKWTSDYIRWELLMLFIKHIRFADGTEYFNRPLDYNDPLSGPFKIDLTATPNQDEINKFADAIDGLRYSKVDMKALTIMEPVGADFRLTETVQIKNTPKSTDNVTGSPGGLESDVNYSDTSAVSLASGLSDGQWHLANQDCSKGQAGLNPTQKDGYGDPKKDQLFLRCGQFYRVYGPEVALCVDAKERMVGESRAGRYITIGKQDIEVAEYEASDITKVRAKERAHAEAKAEAKKAAAQQKPGPVQLPAVAPSPEVDEVLGDKTGIEALGATPTEAIKGGEAMVSMAAHTGGGVAGGNQSASSSTSAGGAPSGGAGAPGGSQSAGASTAMSQVSNALSLNRFSAIVGKGLCVKDELVTPLRTEQEFADSTAGYTEVDWRSASEIIDYLGDLSRLPATNPRAFFKLSPLKSDEYTGKYALVVSVDGERYGIKKDDYLSLDAIRLVKELVDVSKVSSGATIQQPVLFVP